MEQPHCLMRTSPRHLTWAHIQHSNCANAITCNAGSAAHPLPAGSAKLQSRGEGDPAQWSSGLQIICGTPIVAIFLPGELPARGCEWQTAD